MEWYPEAAANAERYTQIVWYK
uniref:Helicopsin (Fragments) n=1 Tax=Helicops angulatus TaxID=121331 RepID=CRVP_HELAG|nr:RecName: Full=Helicopsin [Helicops angulatus]